MNNSQQTPAQHAAAMFNVLTGRQLDPRDAEALSGLLNVADKYFSTPPAPQPESSQPADALTTVNTPETPDSSPWGLRSRNAGKDAVLNNTRDHIDGLDFQIVVLSQVYDRDDSYILHLPCAPVLELVEEHFERFLAGTHFVHVNEWYEGRWMSITHEYTLPTLSSRPAVKAEDIFCDRSVSITATTVDVIDSLQSAAAPCEPKYADWEQADKPYRLHYFDGTREEWRHSYFDKKPNRQQRMMHQTTFHIPELQERD